MILHGYDFFTLPNNTHANLNFAIVTAHCTLLAPLRGAYELLLLWYTCVSVASHFSVCIGLIIYMEVSHSACLHVNMQSG